MENSDSNAWVFDSLVGFLHGPVWNVPLQTFIEEKSLRKFQLHSPIVSSVLTYSLYTYFRIRKLLTSYSRLIVIDLEIAGAVCNDVTIIQLTLHTVFIQFLGCIKL